jgi:hypothetical protein
MRQGRLAGLRDRPAVHGVFVYLVVHSGRMTDRSRKRRMNRFALMSAGRRGDSAAGDKQVSGKVLSRHAAGRAGECA